MGTSEIEEGRFFNESDNAVRADVVVIGSDVANTLMPMISALEKEIIINDMNALQQLAKGTE